MPAGNAIKNHSVLFFGISIFSKRLTTNMVMPPPIKYSRPSNRFSHHKPEKLFLFHAMVVKSVWAFPQTELNNALGLANKIREKSPTPNFIMKVKLSQ